METKQFERKYQLNSDTRSLVIGRDGRMNVQDPDYVTGTQECTPEPLRSNTTTSSDPRCFTSTRIVESLILSAFVYPRILLSNFILDVRCLCNFILIFAKFHLRITQQAETKWTCVSNLVLFLNVFPSTHIQFWYLLVD